MKSIEIKAFILTITLAFTISAKLRREESLTEEESAMKKFSEVEATPQGGDWTNGFNCPSIMLSMNGGKQYDQGGAFIQGAKFMEDNKDNNLGLVLKFFKPLHAKSYMKQIAYTFPDGKLFIPWRFINPNFRYVNPIFAHKYVQGDIRNDQRQSFQIKINFPYKYVGYYIDDKMGNKIRKRINTKSEQVRAVVRGTKEYIDRAYPVYYQTSLDIDRVKKGSAKIDEALKVNQAQINDIKKSNDQLAAQLPPLEAQYAKLFHEAEEHKNQINRLQRENIENNASIQSLDKANKVLEAARNEPKAQIAENEKKLKSVTELNDKAYAELLKLAPEKLTQINKSKADFLQLNEKGFRLNLRSFIPQ